MQRQVMCWGDAKALLRGIIALWETTAATLRAADHFTGHYAASAVLLPAPAPWV